jgi:hypothetical protein
MGPPSPENDRTRGRRLAREAGAAVVIGWGVTALGALLAPPPAGPTAWMLALAGLAAGALLALRRADAGVAVRLVALAACLQAVAAAVAFDADAVTSLVFFALVAAALGRHAPDPDAAGMRALPLAAAFVLVAALAPARAPDAVGNAMLGGAIVVVAALAAARWVDVPGRLRLSRRDVGRVHADLAARAAADPERFDRLSTPDETVPEPVESPAPRCVAA